MDLRSFSPLESDLSLEGVRQDSVFMISMGVFLTLEGSYLVFSSWPLAPLLWSPLVMGGLLMCLTGFDRYLRWSRLREKHFREPPDITDEVHLRRKPGEPLDPRFFNVVSSGQTVDYIPAEGVPDTISDKGPVTAY
jgi:hypothetical protein